MRNRYSPGASRGESAFPQLRLVALVENGTHVLFGARLGGFGDQRRGRLEIALDARRGHHLQGSDLHAVLTPWATMRRRPGHLAWRKARADGVDRARLTWQGPLL